MLPSLRAPVQWTRARNIIGRAVSLHPPGVNFLRTFSGARNGNFQLGDRTPKRAGCPGWRTWRQDAPFKKPAIGGHLSRRSTVCEKSGMDGGRDRDRTCDPLHVKEVLFR